MQCWYFCIAVSLTVTFAAFIAETTFSLPLSPEAQSSEVASEIDFSTSICKQAWQYAEVVLAASSF